MVLDESAVPRVKYGHLKHRKWFVLPKKKEPHRIVERMASCTLTLSFIRFDFLISRWIFILVCPIRSRSVNRRWGRRCPDSRGGHLLLFGAALHEKKTKKNKKKQTNRPTKTTTRRNENSTDDFVRCRASVVFFFDAAPLSSRASFFFLRVFVWFDHRQNRVLNRALANLAGSLIESNVIN